MPDYDINELLNRHWDNYSKYRLIYYYSGDNRFIRILLTYTPGILIVLVFAFIATWFGMKPTSIFPSSVCLLLIYIFVLFSSATKISQQEDRLFLAAINAAVEEYRQNKNPIQLLEALLEIKTRSYNPQIIRWHKMMCAEALTYCNFYADAEALLLYTDIFNDPEGFKKHYAYIEEELHNRIFETITFLVRSYKENLPANIQQNLEELVEAEEFDLAIQELCIALTKASIPVKAVHYLDIVDIIQYFGADECLYEDMQQILL